MTNLFTFQSTIKQCCAIPISEMHRDFYFHGLSVDHVYTLLGRSMQKRNRFCYVLFAMEATR